MAIRPAKGTVDSISVLFEPAGVTWPEDFRGEFRDCFEREGYELQVEFAELG